MAGCSQQKGGLRMGTKKKEGGLFPAGEKRATLILKSHSLMVRLIWLMALFIVLCLMFIFHTEIIMHNPCQSREIRECIDNKRIRSYTPTNRIKECKFFLKLLLPLSTFSRYCVPNS